METIVSRLLHFADAQPDAVAFVEKGQRLTYGGLGRRARATAGWLHGAGVRAGDTVGFSFDGLGTDSIRSLQFFYALSFLGAIILPLYPDVPSSLRRELMTRFGARWLISRHAAESSEERSLIDPGACDWRTCERSGAVAPRGDDPKQPFLFHFSGGTTGMPKVILFNHEQCLATLLGRCAEVGATADDRLVPSRPWPSPPGVRYVLTSHAIGGTAINASFAGTTQELQRLVGELGATIVVMTPWQLRGLLSSAAPPARRRLELKVLYVAGAACAPQEIQAARDAITPNVGVSYGCTEVGLISFLRPTDAVGPAGSVGRLVPGLEAHAADDDYRPVPSGTVGNLGFCAPWIPDGYVGNAQATAAHFHDGWFYPGDVGAVDPERRVSLFGRSDDVINFGGVKLLPDLIEAVLGEHPDIQDVAVVGAPHPMAGQAPVALVVLRRPVAPTALMTFAKSRIQGSQVPVAFVEVPQIFRSADGKILRARLLDEYNVAAS